MIRMLGLLSVMADQLAETRAAVLRVDGRLQDFAPLLDRLQGGEKLGIVGMLKAGRELHHGPAVKRERIS